MRALNADEIRMLRPYIPQVDLQNARLHERRVPWYLCSRFAGITRGNHIYFREHAYVPQTARGLALLGHELTHVGQYRCGMTAATYLICGLFGYRRNIYEKAAFALQARILADLASPESQSSRGSPFGS